MSACGDTPPPRVEIRTPDREQFKTCLGLVVTPPRNLPPYESFKLPDGREVVLLSRVRARDAIHARFLVQVDNARYECRSAVVYADRWVQEMAVTSAEP